MPASTMGMPLGAPTSAATSVPCTTAPPEEFVGTPIAGVVFHSSVGACADSVDAGVRSVDWNQRRYELPQPHQKWPPAPPGT